VLQLSQAGCLQACASRCPAVCCSNSAIPSRVPQTLFPMGHIPKQVTLSCSFEFQQSSCNLRFCEAGNARVGPPRFQSSSKKTCLKKAGSRRQRNNAAPNKLEHSETISNLCGSQIKKCVSPLLFRKVSFLVYSRLLCCDVSLCCVSSYLRFVASILKTSFRICQSLNRGHGRWK
jgi:hypothetical protein